jgi:hypothetical protein
MCKYKTVMLVAPDFADSGHPALDAIPEIDTLQKLGFQPTILQGPVTADRLYSMAQSVQCEILHFITGQVSDDTLLLSKGETLDVHGLLQIVRMTGSKCVFINACQSNYLAQVLVDNGIAVVISTTRSVLDARAKRTAQAFYTMLAKTDDLHAAYVAAKGDDGLYAWTSNGGYTELLLKPVLGKLNELQAALSQNEQEHKDIQASITHMTHTFTPATTIKRYFLRITIAGWVIMTMVIFLFLNVDKVMK